MCYKSLLNIEQALKPCKKDMITLSLDLTFVIYPLSLKILRNYYEVELTPVVLIKEIYHLFPRHDLALHDIQS